MAHVAEEVDEFYGAEGGKKAVSYWLSALSQAVLEEHLLGAGREGEGVVAHVA